MRNRLTRLFSEPLIQFLIIGAGIYWAYALFGTQQDDFRDTRVHVDSARINSFISEWESRWNRPPTRDHGVQVLAAVAVHEARVAVFSGIDGLERRRSYHPAAYGTKTGVFNQ